MKTPFLLGSFAAMCCALALAPATHAYSFTLQPGHNLVANHVNIPAGNNLSQVFAGAPAGAEVHDWQIAGQQFAWAAGSTGSGWTPDPLLNPGSGLLFNLSGASPVTFTVTGTAPTPPVVTLTPGQFQLLGNATATASTTAGTYASIVGAAPSAVGTTVLLRWDRVNQRYLPRRFASGIWTPSAPSVPVGESVLVGVFPPGLPAPNIIRAVVDCDGGGSFIRVSFDADIDLLGGYQIGNFSITGGALTILSAEPEYAQAWPGAMPQPTARAVILRVSGPALVTSTLLTVRAPGLTGVGGTPVNPASFANLQTLLVPVSLSVDCASGTICLIFNQQLDPISAMFLPNYSVVWNNLSSGASGTLSVSSVMLGGGTPGNSNRLNQVCLNVGTMPVGNILFTVKLNSATATPLVSSCGAPLAITPILTISGKCNPVVSGRVFRHQSAPDCVQDLSTSLYGSLPNEYGLPYQWVKLSDGFTDYNTTTDANGDFKVSAPPGTYVLQHPPMPGWVQQCPIGGGGISLTLVTAMTYPGNLFATAPVTPVSDLSVYLYSISQFPPYRTPCCGFDTTLVADYRNTGTEVVLGATVQVVLPPAVLASFVSSTEVPLLPMGYSVSPAPVGGVITWNLPPLAPGQFGRLEAKLMITCPVGSLNSLNASAAITTPIGDPTPADNVAIYSRQTTCSVDPNDKTVRPRGCGPEGYVPVGTEFEYFIQFQNTGSGPAYQVVLRDVLDADLDLSTVMLLGGSHPFVFTNNPSTGELVWLMEGIDLPGATYDEPNSHGWVRFKVKHTPGAPVGTVITNQTAIYFDLNPPVLTSTTTNTLSATPLPVAAFTFSPTVPIVGQSVNFTYTGGTPGVTYDWDFGPDAIPNTSAAPNPTVSYVSTGVKLASLRVKLGDCESEPAVRRVLVSQVLTYTNHIVSGVNLIANQLDIGGNTLGEVLPVVPDDSLVAKWDDTDQLFVQAMFQAGIGWTDLATGNPSVITLHPGEAAFLVNQNAPYSLIFTGTPHVPVLPLSLSPGVIHFVSRQTNAPGTYSNITGLPAEEGSQLLRWDPSTQSYQSNIFTGGTWVPSEPIARVGEGVVVIVPGSTSNPCVTNTIVLNTGYDHVNAVVYPYGTADSFWRVISDPDAGTTEPRPATTILKHPAWWNPTPGSQWLSSYGTYSDNLNGDYVFETRFCLEQGWKQASLSVQVRADDASGIYLNGNYVGTGSPYNSPSPATLTAINQAWFVTGPNILRVVVTNIGAVAMGFNLTGTVSASGLTVGKPECCNRGSGLSGRKFNDLNGNGAHDYGEPWLPGWTIQLSNGSNTVTDVNGYYYFLGLAPGTYTITEVNQPGWTQTTPAGSHVATLGPSQQINNLDFGNHFSGLPQGPQIICSDKPIELQACPEGETLIPNLTNSVIITNVSSGGVTITQNPPAGSPASPGPNVVVITVCNALGCVSCTNIVYVTVVGPPQGCATDIINFNTGYDHGANSIYPIGAADAYWTVISDPDPGTTEPRPATTILKHPAWWTPMTNSQWISSYATAQDDLNGPYNFQTTFCLRPGWSNAVLDVALRADDTAAVYVNGNYVGTITPPPGYWAFNQPVPQQFTVVNQAWFNSGVNFLNIVVTNTANVAMGLNASVRLRAAGLTVQKPQCCNCRSGLSGQKYADLNGNGVRDPGEPALPGWTIQLSNGATAVTDVNGYYFFMGLAPGLYAINEVNQPGWIQTAPAGGIHNVTLGVAQHINQLNFGNIRRDTNAPIIECFDQTLHIKACTEQGAVIPNLAVAIHVWDDTTPPGLITITQTPPAGTPAVLGDNVVVVTACDQFGNCATCTNHVFVVQHSPTGGTCAAQGINLNTGYDHINNTTNAIGVADAFWTVVFDPDAFTTEPRPATAILRHPAWMLPLAGSQWISSYGTYSDNLNGDYGFETTFCLAQGWSNAVLTLRSVADDAAGIYLNGNYIGDAGPYSGPPSTITASNQAWFVTGQNVLRVVVTNLGAVAMGFDLTGTLTAANLTVQKPECCRCVSGLSGHKFNDLNGNGVQDPGEPNMAGWTIVLTIGSNTVTAVTDAHGDYYFMNLPPGVYTVGEVMQPGWVQTAPATGTYTVALSAAQQINQLNFGNTKRDVDPPIIDCRGETIYLDCKPGTVPVIPDMTTNVLAWDNTTPYPLLVFSQMPPAGTPAGPGTNIVVIKVCDAAGNCAYCTNYVVLIDRTPPWACDQPTVTVLSAGTTTDDFVGPEPATPSPALIARLTAAGVTSFKGFDDCRNNAFFAHTFSELPPCIVGAQLRIRLKACDSQLADNDTVGLSFTLPDGTLVSNRWGRYIGAGNASAGLLGSQWSPGNVATFTWNLAALPNADGSFTDLIPQLAQLGFLDVTLQDDSAVDFVELRIVSCCCPQKDIVAPADPATCAAIITYPLPVFHDNCDGIVREVVCNPPSGSAFPIGTTEVCCLAYDRAGNIGRCCFNVTVTAPLPCVECTRVAEPVILDCLGLGVPAPDLTSYIHVVTPCVSNPPIWTVTQTPPAGTVLTFGTHQIVVSACDAVGMCYSCTNEITVVRDTVPPRVICPPGPITVTNCEGKGLVPDYIKMSKYSDNCPNTLYSINQIPGPGTIVGPGSHTVISTICDGAGNCTSCTNTFIVVQGQGEACGCVKPPRGLVLWLPMDETNNVVANNRAGGPNGAYIGNPTIVPEYVLRGRCFNGNNYIRVPSYPAITLGTGDFSIDAWIKRGANDNSPPSIIVDKRAQNATGQLIGYSLSLSFGRLILQLATPSGFVNYTDPTIVPADGNWHFVAVTVRRASPTGIQFYIDGLPTTSANPTAQAGSVANNAPFLVARSPIGGSQPWPGCIDEVEVFNRVLQPAEVLALARADRAGKCKYSASVPQTVQFCKNASTVTIQAKICNQGGQGETFTWTINGLPAGGAYNVAGPVTYTPPGGSVFVPAGACVTVPIVITRPPWMSTAWFANMIGGYQFTAQALHSGTIISATGAVHRPPWGICFNVVRDIKVYVPVGTTYTAAPGGPTGGPTAGSGTDVSMDLDNTDGTNAICHLRLRVIGPDMEPDLATISLNGLPPGTPYEDLLFAVPPGQVGHASVNIAFLEDDPNNEYTLLIESDVDCDGNYEVLGSSQIRQVFQSMMSIGSGEGASSGGLILDWSSEGTLEWAPSVLGPWTELPEATPPYEQPKDGTIKIYRLRQ